jgi:hypothetical protein
MQAGSHRSGAKQMSPPTDFPKRHPDSSFRPIGEEGGLVVLPGKAQVKVLNPAAIMIYGLLDGDHSLDQIADKVAGDFDVTRETAMADLHAFLDELASHGMLAGSGADER